MFDVQVRLPSCLLTMGKEGGEAEGVINKGHPIMDTCSTHVIGHSGLFA